MTTIDLLSDPFSQFDLWFKQAEKEEGPYFNAMTLSSLGSDGRPTSRIVLLKEVLNNKFIFFTNYQSHKGEEIAKDPRVSLCFFWQQSFRQVRIEGIVSKIERSRSVEYFHSRPRGSQVSAVTSQQSCPLSSREEIEMKSKQLEEKFQGQEIPCPEHWGGYEVSPNSIEFWIGMPNRLHHRVLFQCNSMNSKWTSQLLQP